MKELLLVEPMEEPDFADEPITLDMAHSQLRLDLEDGTHPDDDWLMQVGIPAVRARAEEFTGRILVRRKIRVVLRELPLHAFTLPVTPIVSVDAIRYKSGAGDEQTLEADRYSVSVRSGVLRPINGWPLGATDIEIELTAGHDSSSSVPKTITIAMLLMLGHIYKNRESTVERELFQLPSGAESYLRPHRIRTGLA